MCESHIDDRVRAIALAMGMVPIIWTSTPASGPFDTNGKRASDMIENITDSADRLEGGWWIG